MGLIRPSSIVLDLGCAPGSWLQYVARKLNHSGALLGVDLTITDGLEHPRMKTVVDDCFLLTQDKLKGHMSELYPNFQAFDVILSDMAPKTTGIKHVDQVRSFDLAEQALTIAESFLTVGGHVVIKIFASGDVSVLINRMKKNFRAIKQMRPKSIRAPSKEFYVVGIGKK